MPYTDNSSLPYRPFAQREKPALVSALASLDVSIETLDGNATVFKKLENFERLIDAHLMKSSEKDTDKLQQEKAVLEYYIADQMQQLLKTNPELATVFDEFFYLVTQAQSTDELAFSASFFKEQLIETLKKLFSNNSIDSDFAEFQRLSQQRGLTDSAKIKNLDLEKAELVTNLQQNPSAKNIPILTTLLAIDHYCKKKQARLTSIDEQFEVQGKKVVLTGVFSVAGPVAGIAAPAAVTAMGVANATKTATDVVDKALIGNDALSLGERFKSNMTKGWNWLTDKAKGFAAWAKENPIKATVGGLIVLPITLGVAAVVVLFSPIVLPIIGGLVGSAKLGKHAYDSNVETQAGLGRVNRVAELMTQLKGDAYSLKDSELGPSHDDYQKLAMLQAELVHLTPDVQESVHTVASYSQANKQPHKPIDMSAVITTSSREGASHEANIRPRASRLEEAAHTSKVKANSESNEISSEEQQPSRIRPGR